MVLRAGCAILVWHPPFAISTHLFCIGKLGVCFDPHVSLVLLHFPWFFLGPPVCFLQFFMVLPSFLHSLPRLNGLESRVCHRSVAHPICKTYAPVLYWKAPCTFGLALERNGQGKEKERKTKEAEEESLSRTSLFICIFSFMYLV